MMKKLLRLGLLTFIFILVSGFIKPVLFSDGMKDGRIVYADSKAPSAHDFSVFEVLFQWQSNRGGCPHDDNDFKHKITVSNYNKAGYYGYNSGTDAVNTSSYVDENLPGDGNDERIKCSTIFKAITTEIFGGRKQYLDTVYDTTTVQAQADDKYYFSNDTAMPGEDDFGQYMNNKITAKILEYRNRPDWGAWLQIYINDRVIQAYERCKGDSNVIVGYLTELEVEGEYRDGKIDCGDVLTNYYKDHDLENYDKDAEILKLDPSGESTVDTRGSKDGGNSDGSGEPCYDAGSFGFFKNPLKWITCGVSQLLASAIDGVNEAIESMLLFNPTTDNRDGLYSVWSNILNIANVLFVIAFLIMVISTALDLGIFSNYTVKKLLPRIIIAAILANLSWGICSLIIQIVNDIGGAVQSIILSPLGGDGSVKFTLGRAVNTQGAEGVNVAIGTISSAVVVGLGTLVYFAIGTAGAILLPIITVTFVAALTALIVLILRRIIIILLIIAAPLAFALWALPGGEKYFQKWWKVFAQMMLMYPIIMALFASGLFISQLLSGPATDEAGVGIMTSAIATLAVVLPYFVLPLLFKAASGVLGTVTGMVNDRGKGLIDRSKNLRNKSVKKKYERDVAPSILQKRSEYSGRLQASASKGGRLRSFALGKAASGVGGYNIEAAMSARNAQEKKVIEDQIATGRDDEIRGLSVNKKAVDRMGWAEAERQGLVRMDPKGTGKKQYKTLGGAFVDEAAVDAGHKRWGKNQFAQQAALSYEIRKAAKTEDIEGLTKRYQSLATEQWGNSERQATGTWKGSTFENQGTHMALKHTSWKGDLNASEFATEMYEKKGSYPIANMTAHSIEKLGEAYDDGDQHTQGQVKAIMETFVQRGARGGQVQGMTGEGDNAQPQFAPQVIDPGGGQMAGTYAQGAAHVNEAVNKVARRVGVMEQVPDGDPGALGDPIQPYSPQNESGPPVQGPRRP